MMKKMLIAALLLIPLLAGCASDFGWVKNTVKAGIQDMEN
jgi:PBP1b-binding outer membrane lipoprotein LpoB